MNTSETLVLQGGRGRRYAKVSVWVLQALLALLFAFSGFAKLANLSPEIAVAFGRIGFGAWFQYFVGGIEIAGALGLLIPRLAGLAALGLAGLMVGAVATQVLLASPIDQAVLPAILVVVFALIARHHWQQVRTLAHAIGI